MKDKAIEPGPLQIVPEPVAAPPQKGGAFSSMAAFEDAQRMAKALCTSTLVPAEYQNNIGNAIIALEMAGRIGASPLAVMQNLYVIHGRPSWSSQFTIGALNSCGLFSPLRYEDSDKDGGTCRAYAVELATGEQLNGPSVSIKMAKAEGWYQKNGSKWQTMPELMLRYRAAAFFGRLYAPHILNGMGTEDEAVDIAAAKDVTPAPVTLAPSGASNISEPVATDTSAKDEPFGEEPAASAAAPADPTAALNAQAATTRKPRRAKPKPAAAPQEDEEQPPLPDAAPGGSNDVF